MIVVDASVLIAHFSTADAHHDSAEALLERVVGDDLCAGELCAHPLTLAEMLVGAARTHRAEKLRSDIRALGVDQWVADHDEPIRLAKLRVETGLKLPDCCVLSAAMATNASLATFDNALSTSAMSLGIPCVR